jgi:hypothetical protein
MSSSLTNDEALSPLDSLERKSSWLDAVRDAKAALMSDRRTLQRATIVDSIAPSRDNSTKSERRVSLPSPSKNPTSFLGIGSPPTSSSNRQASAVPQLTTIPPTPSVEPQTIDFPFTPVTPRTTSPVELPPSPSHPPRSSATSSTAASVPSRQASELPPPTRRPSLARVRRWSELRPSDAVQAITSAFIPSSTSSVIEQLSNDEMEYKVIEAYHAPVWVPDSKAEKCMRCGDGFGIWRRKHHCRLCGGVVCWACSTKVSSALVFWTELLTDSVLFRSKIVLHHSWLPPSLLFGFQLSYRIESIDSSAGRSTRQILRYLLHSSFRRPSSFFSIPRIFDSCDNVRPFDIAALR